MKRILAATAISLTMGEPLMAQEGSGGGAMPASASSLSVGDIQSVSPALGRYAEEDVLGNLWQRPQLSRRDRSIVTLSVLIARNQAIDLKHYVDVALDNGVSPTEISEIITHLAFYAGWSNAMSAVAATKDVFKDRGITADQLPAASATAAAQRRGRAATRHRRREECRSDLSGAGAVYDRPAVPRSLATAGSCTARPQPRDGQLADRIGPERPDHLSPQPRHG